MKRFFSFHVTQENESNIFIHRNESPGEFFRFISEDEEAFIIVDTGFKTAWADGYGDSKLLRKAYPVSGGERCKSIDRVFELINSIQNQERRIKRVIAIGGGALIDLCGYVCYSSIPDAVFEIVPTTPFSQLAGFYARRFYLNYDREKNRLSIQGFPEKNHIFPNLLKTYTTDDFRKAHVAAYSVALGFDERFYHLVKRSLKEMVHDHIDWDHLSELIWENNFLRAKASKDLMTVFPGETMANFIQNATGLQTDYISAFNTGIRMELFLSNRLDFLDDNSYHQFEDELKKLLDFKRADFDFQSFIMNIRRGKSVVIPLIKGLGKSERTRIRSKTLEELLITFFSEIE
jgi:3-dehydroquinate synthetase